MFLMLLRLFIAALWSPAGKGLTSWLLLVMFIVLLLLSRVVSWVWCGTWLYRFLIFAIFITLSMTRKCHNHIPTNLWHCKRKSQRTITATPDMTFRTQQKQSNQLSQICFGAHTGQCLFNRLSKVF